MIFLFSFFCYFDKFNVSEFFRRRGVGKRVGEGESYSKGERRFYFSRDIFFIL